MRSHWLALIFLLAAAPAWSADCAGVDLSADPAINPDWTRFADDLVNGEGLLWRIEKPGVEPSFLFGTVNSTNARAVAVATEADAYLKSAAVVATEFGDIDKQAQADANANLMRRAGEPERDVFEGLIEGEDAGRVEALLARKGFSREQAHHQKLWLLMIYAIWPACEVERLRRGIPTVENYVVAAAKGDHVDVLGLLTLDEYDRALESIPDADASSELKLLARNDAFLDDAYATTIALYEQKRLGATRAFVDAQRGKALSERQANDSINKIAGFNFNDTLAQRARPLVAKGGAFLAVAALHLWGARGLVEQFRAMGYTVTKVW